MKELPIVSVVMITYGHEKFVKQAIEGVLMQQGDFELELIIANDCSPDNSDFIITEIVKNSEKTNSIKYFRHEKNIGVMPNFYFALSKCSGNYIAICEGDDYWIDSFKLEKQLKIIESDFNIGLVYSKVRKLFQESGKFVDEKPRTATLENQVRKMVESKYIEFATTLFRKDLLVTIAESLKEEMFDKVIGDTRILLETAHRTKIGFLDEITTVYRINQGSVTQSLNIDKFVFAQLDTYYCRKNFVVRYNYPKKWLSIVLANTFKNLVIKAYQEKNLFNSLRILNKIPFVDVILYSEFKLFFQKNNYKVFLKLILTISGLKYLIK